MAGSLIGANNINIFAEDAISQALTLNNIGSAIKAENLLGINAQNINNEGISDINTDVQRGIKTSMIYTYAPYEQRKLSLSGYERAKVVHTAAQAILSGLESEINAGGITNKSALIEGTDKLTINAENMTNTAITFTDVLKREMTASLFSRKWGDWLHTWYADEWRNFVTPFYETYVFGSQTAGEITGKEIDITLTGKLTIDENKTPLIRAEEINGTALSTVYSNISGENVTIKADSIDNYGMINGNETLKIAVENDFINADAVIKGGDIEIETGGMFKSERQAIPLSGSSSGFTHTSNYVNAYGLISATGKLNILSHNGVHVTGTNIIAMDGGAVYVSEGNILMEALEYNDSWSIDKKINMADNKGSDSKKQISKGTLTIYNDFNLFAANGDINYEAYDIRGRGNLTLGAPNGNIIFTSKEAEEDYTFVLKMNMGWQGSEENRWSEYKSYHVGSTVEVMGKIEIIAGNNINILASSLESLSEVISLTAGMDVNVLAGENYESAETVKIKTGSITIGGGDLASVSSSRDSRFDDEMTLAGSSIKGSNISITSGRDTNVVASNVEARNDLTVNAGNNLNVLSGYESTSHKEIHETMKIGIGKVAIAAVSPIAAIAAGISDGNADLMNFKMSSTEDRSRDMAAKGSMLTSGGNMSLTAGQDITVGGSIVEATGDASLKAGGNINVLSAEQLKTTYYSEESIEVKGGGINNIDVSQLDRGRISVELGKGEMKGTETEDWLVTQAGSSIKSGGKLSIEAEGDLNLKASNLFGDEISVDVTNINVLTADESYKLKTSEKSASVTISAGISNSFVDAYYAGDALVKAGEMQAKAESELSRIQKLYDEGKASKSALDDAKTNLTLARANLVAATTNAIASVASAAASAKTGGFNASLMIDMQVSESSHKETTTNAIGSLISANKDITLKAKNDITQIGSTVISQQGDISYEAGNKVSIKAGENSRTTSSASQNYNASYTYGTGGYSANAGFSLANSGSDDIWHTNSTIQADQGKVSIKTGLDSNAKGDMEFKGANILAKDVELDIKGNLDIASLQDTHRSDGKQAGANAGISGGTKLSSAVTKYNTGTAGATGMSGGTLGASYGQSKEDAAWVNQQTSIIGSNSVSVNVGEKLSNTGAVIANADYNIDDQGKITYSNDQGNLIINAKEFEYKDLKDHNYTNSYHYGAQMSLGRFDKGGNFAASMLKDSKNLNMTFKNQGYEKEQINRATIGQGKVIVDGIEQTDEQLAGLNRDIEKSQEITRDQLTNALDAELNVDLRFLISVYDVLTGATEEIKDEEGNVIGKRKKELSVVQDVKTIQKAVKEISAAIKKASAKRIEKKLAAAEADKKTRNKIINDEKVMNFETAAENLDKVEEYIKANNVDSETAEKLRRAALDEGVLVINHNGKLYVIETNFTIDGTDKESIFASLERTAPKDMMSEEYLNRAREGSAEETYKIKLVEAKESITSILLSESKTLAKMGKDSVQLAKDTQELLVSIAGASLEKETYARAFEGVLGLLSKAESGINLTLALSNPYVMGSFLEGAGGLAYDVRNDPLGTGIGIAKNVTSWHMYVAGASQDNFYYAAGLIFAGLAMEIGSPLKLLKGVSAGADLAKAGIKVADNALAQSGKGLTTIGESASIGKTGITLGDLKAAQPGVDNFWTNFSEKTWSGYTTYYPTGTIDDYMTILHKESPWPLGYDANAHRMQLTSNDSFNMVLNKGQPNPGGFAVKENITTVTQARNDLALKQVWKPEPERTVTYRPKDGIVLDALYGPIGPQIDLPANKFLPGNPNMTQYELLFPKGTIAEQRINFIEKIPGSKINLK